MPGTPAPFAPFEWMIAWRYLRAKRAEGGVSVMTWISLIGITLAVFALIVTLAVRSGFRAEFVDTILGSNAHVTIYSAGEVDAVTGRIDRGIVNVGDEIEIVGIKDTEKTTCTGVEMFRKLLDEGRAGDNVGVLLRGTKREEVERGQVLAAPGTITPHTKFEAEVYILTKEEGGRHTPFFKGYRPQFYFRTTDVTGAVELPADTEMVMPGDNIQMTVDLIAPIAMEDGLRFAIREGGRTVGAGVVAKVIE